MYQQELETQKCEALHNMTPFHICRKDRFKNTFEEFELYKAHINNQADQLLYNQNKSTRGGAFNLY